jgi:hypothetical protein
LNFVGVFRFEAGDMKAFCRSGLRKEQFSRESGLGGEFLLRDFAKIKVERFIFEEDFNELLIGLGFEKICRFKLQDNLEDNPR